jgi:hypothetical protein
MALKAALQATFVHSPNGQVLFDNTLECFRILSVSTRPLIGFSESLAHYR